MIKNIIHTLKSWSLFITIISIAFIIALGIMLLLFKLTNFTISFAAIAASIFIVFVSQDQKATSYKNIYGSYTIAAACGYLGITLGSGSIIATALTLMIAIIIMVLIKTVHAPAIGFVFSFMLHPFNLMTIFLVMLCVFALIFIAKSLRHIIKNPGEFHLSLKDEKIKFKFRKKQRNGYLVVKDGVVKGIH